MPSQEHQEVPYYCLLLEDEVGLHYVRKSRQEHRPGDVLAEGDEGRTETAVTLGVIGTGTMGTGIVCLAMEAGWQVIWKSRSSQSLSEGKARVRDRLLKAMEPGEADGVLQSLVLATDFEALAGAGLVVESVVEDLDVKRNVFRSLDEACSQEAILASNSSSLSIDAMAAVTSRPERIVGMHFFNPVSRMRLVEVVRGARTADATAASVSDLAKRLGKVPVVVRDAPGFIVNRVLMPYLNEAARIVQEGIASVDDVDTAVELGLGHPMGPLGLIDLIGVDVFVNIMDSLASRTGESRFGAAEVARRLVAEGRLGRKTGAGFHQ
ncbi:MAG: 3-hydroxyacyl-CoA dehydrogenase family protein [Armatimonadota bacterium]|nr:MAG: 3-hydroxyacyl-CoA dehydrogenase family protein [Armatimonadota bacterium]